MKMPTWGEMMADITLTVKIKPPKHWKWRVKIFGALMRLAVRIVGIGSVEVVELGQ